MGIAGPRGSQQQMFRDEPTKVEGGTVTMDVAELQELEVSGSRRSIRLLMAAGFGVVLLLAGGTAFWFASSDSGTDTGADLAASYDTALVANEENDPEPLSPDELFGQDSIELTDGTVFNRVHTDDTTDCAGASHGAFGEVLVDNECRQVLRASYLSEDGQHAVTAGVAAFPTDEHAAAAQEAQDIGAAAWFAGLAGPEDSGTEHLDAAGGHGSGATWGRYTVFALATGDEDAVDEDTLATISEEFINVPLVPLGERALG